MRRVVWGSNNTALSKLKTKVWFCPTQTGVSARIRAVSSLPAARVTTYVSAPAGSMISSFASSVPTVHPPRPNAKDHLRSVGELRGIRASRDRQDDRLVIMTLQNYLG